MGLPASTSYASCFLLLVTGFFMSRRLLPFFVLASFLVSFLPQAFANLSSLEQVSIEDLLNTAVASVSRKEERLIDTAAAIDVLTAEDIRRSSALILPDLLRDAAGLNVASANDRDWAISARGFTSVQSNKLEVMIDGRSVYSPLFSGTYWDTQDTILADLDRIEVMRGPGATMWGSNAVNGVISIYTKPADQTQGLLTSVAGGNHDILTSSMRYGFVVAPDTYARVYGKFFSHDTAILLAEDSLPMHSGLEAARTGFRVDSYALSDTELMLQGEYYTNEMELLEMAVAKFHGGHVMGRVNHYFDRDTSLSLQVYFEDQFRRNVDALVEERETFDLSSSFRTRVADRHDIVAGFEYKISSDDTIGSNSIRFDPASRTIKTANVYIQDEVAIIRDRFYLTAGAMLIDNTYMDWDVQPTLRVRYHPNSTSTIWAAVSRALRVPSRFDTDAQYGNPAFLVGSGAYLPEELVAYEIGYRLQPKSNLYIDVALFSNHYKYLRSIGLEEDRNDPPLMIGNLSYADSMGAEVLVTYTPVYWWRMQLWGSYFEKDLRAIPQEVGIVIGADPRFTFSLRNSIELPREVEADIVIRHSTSLDLGGTPAYTALDLRLSWAPRDNIELALVGRDLLDGTHVEIPGDSPGLMRRTIYFQFTGKF